MIETNLNSNNDIRGHLVKLIKQLIPYQFSESNKHKKDERKPSINTKSVYTQPEHLENKEFTKNIIEVDILPQQLMAKTVKKGSVCFHQNSKHDINDEKQAQVT